MPVLKANSSAYATHDAVVLDLADIAHQGEAILRTARDEAARIVAQAREERERLIGDASAVGHREGYAKGLAEGREAGNVAGETAARAEHAERLRALQSAWSEALEEFLSQRDHLLVTCKTDVLRLALSIAERITHRTIATNESVVCDQIEAALAVIGRPSRVLVAVSPDDLELARDTLPDLAARLETVEHAELVVDESLAPGSCVVRTADGGLIDASVQTQLRRIAELIVPGSSASVGARPADASDDGEAESRGELAA